MYFGGFVSSLRGRYRVSFAKFDFTEVNKTVTSKSIINDVNNDILKVDNNQSRSRSTR